MPMHVRSGGAWRQVASPRVRVGGTWRNVQQGWVRVAGVWRRFYNAFSVSASNVSGSTSSLNVCGNVTTATFANPTVTGGVGPFTYSWTRVDSNGGVDFSISGSTQSNPIWTGNVCDPGSVGTTLVQTWRVTVTDTGAGNATTSTDITVSLSWFYSV